MAIDLAKLPQAVISDSTAVVMSALTVSGVVLMLVGEYVRPSKLLRWSKDGGY